MTSAYPGIGVASGQVMTVLGPVPVEQLGITHVHEHILIDAGVNGPEPAEASRKHLFHRPLTIDILGDVRALPMSNRDNQRLGDTSLAVEELRKYAFLGGGTNIDQTVEGLGRDPLGVQHVSRGSGVNIILGDGSVHFIKDHIELETWRALSTRGDCEVLASYCGCH